MKKVRQKSEKKYALVRNYTALGRYLQEMRLHADLTQRQVSLALGYSSAQFISNFENGIVSPPLVKLRTLIDLLKMSESRVLALLLEGEKKVIQAAINGSRSKPKTLEG